VKLELFYSPGCARCAEARDGLKAAALSVVQDLDWKELNVLNELDYAVELGVLSLPAVAIDGELVFTSLPSQRQLCKALAARRGKRV
jgi:thioredoxin 1